jgi:hypothetical protein
MQHADVVIVPHLVSAFTESLDPIKAYECVAVGRPTVATAVAGFRDLGLPVRTSDAAHFAACVEQALADTSVPMVRRDAPTWAQRGADFAAALDAARDPARDPARDAAGSQGARR